MKRSGIHAQMRRERDSKTLLDQARQYVNEYIDTVDTPAQTRGILANIQASGVCWCGGTQWGDQPAIRISVSSWVTTPEDVDRSVEAFVDARSKARRDDTDQMNAG